MAPWWLRSKKDEDYEDDLEIDDATLASIAIESEFPVKGDPVEGDPVEDEGIEADEADAEEAAVAEAAPPEEAAEAEAEAPEEAAEPEDDPHDEEAFAIAWEPGESDSREDLFTDAPADLDEDEEPEPPEEAEEKPATESRRKRRRRHRKRKPAAKKPAVEAPPSQEAEAREDKTGEEAAPPVPRDETEAQSQEEIVFDFGEPERTQPASDERKIAMFCDLENIALGVRNSETKKFDINLVLKRLLEKGKIIVKKAYADWERYSDYKRAFHEAAIELIDIPQKHYSGKNSADIKMVVDAMDLCYSKEHLDTFVVLSGDSDFSPLVSKLKENNKYVIGVGVKNSTSNHLIDNCDEFIYYEDVWRDLQRTPALDHLSPKDAEVFGLLIDSILALVRENKTILWGSMIKQTMQRKRPSFSEGYYGHGSFTELLEDARKKDIIRLKRDQRSGNYVVTGFGQQG